MQSIEAMISLMVLVAICSAMLEAFPERPGVDDSLYRYQLANDAWRVLSLRGDFRNLDNLGTGCVKRDAIESDLTEIHSLTGICGFFSGIVATPQDPCRIEGAGERIMTINRAVYIDGSLESVTFTLAHPDD